MNFHPLAIQFKLMMVCGRSGRGPDFCADSPRVKRLNLEFELDLYRAQLSERRINSVGSGHQNHP
jgi:hypothetical protein